MELKEWIRAARAHKKWTQTQLGDALGVTKGNISAWEVGRHEPSFGQVQKAAELTGFPAPGSQSPPQPSPDAAAELDFKTAALMAAYATEDESDRELLVSFLHEVSKRLEKMAESARNVKTGTPL